VIQGRGIRHSYWFTNETRVRTAVDNAEEVLSWSRMYKQHYSVFSRLTQISDTRSLYLVKFRISQTTYSLIAVIMEAARTSETSVDNYTAVHPRRQI
jgi:hypothetical protein